MEFVAFDSDYVWIVVVAFVVSFVLAIGLGANDCANTFGTAVGSKVFTLVQACILAAIFETLGAILLGSRVSDTIRKGLFDPLLYVGYEQVLMIGNLCALCSSCMWLLVATVARVPVSASHSIVGATLGFHLVMFGGRGIEWNVIVKIVISWFVSPALSGIISCLFFLIIKFTVLERKQQLKWGLLSLPFWYFFVIAINLLSIFLGSALVIDNVGVWLVPVIAVGVGLFVAVGVLLFLVPYTRSRAMALLKLQAKRESEKETEKETVIDMDIVAGHSSVDGEKHGAGNAPASGPDKSVDEPDAVLVPGAESPNQNQNNSNRGDEVVVGSAAAAEAKAEPPGPASGAEDREPAAGRPGGRIAKKSAEWLSVKDSVEVTAICGPMQGLSACFAAFSHGGNDVSNAIGPLVGLYLIYTQGEISDEASTPIWLLLYGGAGISVGLFVLGRLVIQTVGSDLTPMTPSTGFAINLGAAVTVLIASNLGIPVSTTHCLVGSVCAVGLLRSRQSVDWRLFSGIFSAWIVTVPVTVLLSAALMGLLQHTVPGILTLQPVGNTTAAGAAAATMALHHTITI